MRRRLSISRMMVTIGLLGLSMSLLKFWVEPKNFLGFLGILGWMILNFWIATYATTGSARRFFAGAGITGTFLWLLVFFAPSTLMGFGWNGLVFPLIRSISSYSKTIDYQYRWYWVEKNLLLSSHFDQGLWGRLQIRTTIGIGSPEIQVLMLIPFATLAILGGLITNFARRPINRPTESLAT